MINLPIMSFWMVIFTLSLIIMISIKIFVIFWKQYLYFHMKFCY